MTRSILGFRYEKKVYTFIRCLSIYYFAGCKKLQIRIYGYLANTKTRSRERLDAGMSFRS